MCASTLLDRRKESGSLRGSNGGMTCEFISLYVLCVRARAYVCMCMQVWRCTAAIVCVCARVRALSRVCISCAPHTPAHERAGYTKVHEQSSCCAACTKAVGHLYTLRTHLLHQHTTNIPHTYTIPLHTPYLRTPAQSSLHLSPPLNLCTYTRTLSYTQLNFEGGG